MIKYLSNKAATYIAQNDETADFEVMAYGFELLFQEVAVLIVAMLLALPFGLSLQVLVTFISYNILRASAGGAHANHRSVCVCVSTLVTFGPAFAFTRLGLAIPVPVMAGLLAADLLILALFAPGDTEMKPIQTPAKRRRYKIRALTTAAVYFALAFAFRGRLPTYAYILAAVPTMISLLNLPLVYWMFGCKRSVPEKGLV